MYFFLIELKRILMVIWNCSKEANMYGVQVWVEGKVGWVWNLTVIQPGVLDRIRPGDRGDGGQRQTDT